MGTLVVPDGLRPWVAEIEIAAASGKEAVDMPDHATTLIVRTTPGERRAVVVIGPRTSAAYHVADVGTSCVRVRLQPGRGKALLEQSVREFTDRAVRVRGLPGLDAEGLIEDPVGALTTVFAERRVDGQLLMEAAELILAGKGIADTAQRLHISERHLRGMFVDGMGISPKHFARIDRVRNVLATPRKPRWADVATEVGYYDQSHMTREFRLLMGVPPAAFSAGRRPVAQRCGLTAESVSHAW